MVGNVFGKEKGMSLVIAALISIITVAVIGVGIYIGSGAEKAENLQSSERHSSIPVPKFSIDLIFGSAEGFAENTIRNAPPSGFPRFVIRRGETGKIKVRLKELYSGENLWIKVRLYGIAPEFDNWIYGGVENEGLPENAWYSISPSLVKLSENETVTCTLEIHVGRDVQAKSYKLCLEAYLGYTSSGPASSSTGRSFTLRVKKRHVSFESPKDTVESLISAYNRRDVEAYENCFSEDVWNEVSENSFNLLLSIAENWKWKLTSMESWNPTPSPSGALCGTFKIWATGVNQISEYPIYEGGEIVYEGGRFGKLIDCYICFTKKEKGWKVISNPGFFLPAPYVEVPELS